MSDDLKEHIANADLSGLIKVLAEIIAEEWINENAERENDSPDFKV